MRYNAHDWLIKDCFCWHQALCSNAMLRASNRSISSYFSICSSVHCFPMDASCCDATITRDLSWQCSFCRGLLFYWFQTGTSQKTYTLQMYEAGVAFVANLWQWRLEFIWNILSILWAVEAVQPPTEQEMYRIIWTEPTALVVSAANISHTSIEDLHINKWMHRGTPNRLTHKSPRHTHTHAQLMLV